MTTPKPLKTYHVETWTTGPAPDFKQTVRVIGVIRAAHRNTAKAELARRYGRGAKVQLVEVVA